MIEGSGREPSVVNRPEIIDTTIRRNVREPGGLYDEPSDDEVAIFHDRHLKERVKQNFARFMAETASKLLMPLLSENLEVLVAEDLGLPETNLREIKRRVLSGESLRGLIGEKELERLNDRLSRALEKLQGNALAIVRKQLEYLRRVELSKAREMAHVQEEKYSDEMTGLLSKKGIERAFKSVVENAAEMKDDERVIFISFDIDDFKKMNGIFTHEGADRFLIALAKRLKDHLRISDDIARRSGDEFVIIARVNRSSVNSYLKKIRDFLSPPYTITLQDEENGNGQKRKNKEVSYQMVASGGAAVISKKDLLSGKGGKNDYEYWASASDMAAGYAKTHKRGEFVLYSDDLEELIYEMGDRELELYAGAVVEQEMKRHRNDIQLEINQAQREGQPELAEAIKRRLEVLEKETKPALLKEKVLKFQEMRLKKKLAVEAVKD